MADGRSVVDPDRRPHAGPAEPHVERPPGAMIDLPGLDRLSVTALVPPGIPVSAATWAANTPVKIGGMCCTTRIGTLIRRACRPGPRNTWITARGPPVEAPIRIAFRARA